MQQIFTSRGGACPFRLRVVCVHQSLKGGKESQGRKTNRSIDEKARDGERSRCVCVDTGQEAERCESEAFRCCVARTYRVCVLVCLFTEQ